MSVKRGRTKKYQRSDEISSSYSSSESSSDEETDVRDLKSIKEYLSNRTELASQLFKSVKTDKIRMMLPQILKKMDFKELEELCANEVSGMSKSRIISIINGQQMVESSDTNESDGSGPSLEIISDTEEWLTDESGKKDAQLANANSKSIKFISKHKNKIHNLKKINDKTKTKIKTEPKDKAVKLKVKVEGEKDSAKEKEGDSLLDLLELEMRARAIRALIRKEEDIVPTTSDPQCNVATNSSTTKALDKKISMVKQRVIKELHSQQLENIMKQSEEEDVVLVVQPTPIIELLSTDDEDGNEKENEEEEQSENQVQNKTKHANKEVNNLNKETNKEDNNEALNEESNKSTIRNIQQETDKTLKQLPKDKTKKSDSSKGDKFKKIKKKCSKKMRERVNDSIENEEVKEAGSESTENLNTEKLVGTNSELEKAVILEKNEEPSSGKRKSSSKKMERKVIDNDMEEIIDLDDYPDDMEDMEDDDSLQETKSLEKTNNEKANSAETWASRYYKTDDVQSVIKESKIQSEIRKRLRERQRLCKINNSPTNMEKKETEVKVQVEEITPIGSVQEYLALKATMSSDSNDNVNNSNIRTEDGSNSGDGKNELGVTETNEIAVNNEDISNITNEESKNVVEVEAFDVDEMKKVENIKVVEKDSSNKLDYDVEDKSTSKDEADVKTTDMFVSDDAK